MNLNALNHIEWNVKQKVLKYISFLVHFNIEMKKSAGIGCAWIQK